MNGKSKAGERGGKHSGVGGRCKGKVLLSVALLAPPPLESNLRPKTGLDFCQVDGSNNSEVEKYGASVFIITYLFIFHLTYKNKKEK